MILSIDVGERNFAYCIGDLEKVYAWKRHDVKKKKHQTVIESCKLISNILEHEKDLIDQCSAVVIERQPFENLRGLQIAQHIWTWCWLKHPGKDIVFFSASKKTQYFLGKNSLDYPGRKQWSVEKTCDIIRENYDSETRAMYDAVVGKKDDICDAFLQMRVYLSQRGTKRSATN